MSIIVHLGKVFKRIAFTYYAKKVKIIFLPKTSMSKIPFFHGWNSTSTREMGRRAIWEYRVSGGFISLVSLGRKRRGRHNSGGRGRYNVE